MAMKFFKRNKGAKKGSAEETSPPDERDLKPEEPIEEDQQIRDILETSHEDPPPATPEESVPQESSISENNNSETPKKGFFAKFRKKHTEDKPDDLEAISGADFQPEESQKIQQIPESTEPVSDDVESEGKKQGLFNRLRNRLTKTRKAFVSRVDQLLLGKKEIDEELLEELEEILITSDIGVQTTMALIDEVREQVERKDLNNAEELREALEKKILGFLKVPSGQKSIPAGHPHVIMVVGVNGVGKTTTIGKLAARYTREKKRVLLVAADTFRAAAVEQLEIWAQRVGAEVVRHKGASDPSAVAFDGIQAAISRDVDVVIIDTAGRLHTKVNLMEELKKIRRTVARNLPDAPHETLLVLDATTGQNAISQAQLFHKAIELTGIALTKLDGTAKGGIVVGICHSLGIPLEYIGLGEKVDDMQAFDPDDFMKAMF